MAFYPTLLLVMAGVAAFIGLENLVMAHYRRRRLYLWVGLLGLSHAVYCLFSAKVYASSHYLLSGVYQLGQLFSGGLMLAAVVCIGLEFLERLGRLQLYAVFSLTLLCNALLPLPGMGLSGEAAIKEVAWAGVVYREHGLGPAPTVFFAIVAVWLAWITAQLWRRVRQGGGRSALLVALVYSLWFVAAANDMLVGSGVYASLYVAEFAIAAVLGITAAVLQRQRQRDRALAEEQRRQLVVELSQRDGELASVQAELLEAAKLAEVGRLAAGVAHEVNNPLTFIHGNLDLLARELAGDEELIGLVEGAREGVVRIKTVVEQLYGFSEAEFTRGPGDVAGAVAAVVERLRPEFGRRAGVEVALAPGLPPVQLNDAMLDRVLHQVLLNAGQAIRPGQAAENRIEVRGELDAGADEVVITVEDSGRGIAPAVLERMFDPFVTTRRSGEGVGLGLTVTRAVLHQVGGWIRGENRAEGGARFVLAIPVYTGRPTGELPVRDLLAEELLGEPRQRSRRGAA